MSTTIRGLKVKISADLTEFRKRMAEMDRAMAPVRQRLQSFGQAMSIGVSAPLAALGVAAFRSAARVDSLKRGLAAVTKETGPLSLQLNRLKDVARLPGLGFEEAIQGSTNLQAVGFSAQQSERILKSFGNALATVGKGKVDLEGVVTALSQIQAKGKVSAEEINQIAERVPQIRKAMQDAFGTADTEVLQKMAMSTEQFIGGVVGELEKLEKVQGGIQNSWENLGDSAGRALAAIGDTLANMLLPWMDKAASALERFAGWWDRLPEAVRKGTVAFAALAAVVGPLSLGIAALMTPIGLLAVKITAAAAALGAAAYIIYDNWEPLVKFFANLFDQVTIEVSKGILQVLALAHNVASILSPASQGMIVDLMAGQLEEMGKAQKSLAARGPVDILGNLKGSVGTVAETFRSAIDAVRGFGGGLGNMGANAGKAGRALAGLRQAMGLKPDERVLAEMRGRGKAAAEENADWTTGILADRAGFRTTDAPERLASITEGVTRLTVALAEMGAGVNATLAEGLNRSLDIASSALADLVTGFRSFKDVVASLGQSLHALLADMVQALLKMATFRGLQALLGASTGGVGAFILEAIQPRAMGGPVFSGSSYLVGERGPELFTPGQSGSITPNHMLGGGGGTLDVSFRSHLLSNGIVLQAVRQGLRDEIRQGRGDGTL